MATKDALAACQALLNLGSQLNSSSGSIQGTDIESQLEAAKGEASSAALRNAKQWGGLSKDVDVFVATLEGGHNASSAEAQAIDTDCSQFLPPPTTAP